MKKTFIPVALAVAIASTPLCSCIGSFSLSNKLLGWNKQVGGKVVNELVFIAFCIIPVYEVSLIADAIVFNSIEFWSGDNPVASGKRVIEGEDGRYLVEADRKGYTISREDGAMEPIRLDYDDKEMSWSAVMPDGTSYELMTFVDDNHLSLPAADGSRIVVPADEQGLMAYREAASAILVAQR
ncbi:MAG: DUF3332 domain-containing protein [Duncaniella sp.]|nr:DUF3332 domain-containing protein [Duncaniella sp.]MDE6179064.1 DUF3332 domain-containing protein [Duncaniella sp.]